MLPTDIPYLIGETAFHHQGDKEFLKELINIGAEADVNAIKFHLLFNLEDYMVSDHEAIDLIKSWCFHQKDWEEILQFTREKGLDIILLCNDLASLDWVLQYEIDVKAIELHATGINDFFLLKKATDFEGTVILGTGGSTLDEIHYAIDFLKSKGKYDIFLMHGFQNYPTDFREINLSKMRQLHELFNLPVGYADHTNPEDEDNTSISVLGAAMGFNVLEKHFTHVFGEKRIDAQAAISKDQLIRIRQLLNKVVTAYGSSDLHMSDAEKKYGQIGPMKKAIVARRNINKGEKLSLENLAFKRTNESSYVKQMNFLGLIGLEVVRDIKKDELIDFSKVNYTFSKADFSQFKHNQK